jgi:hypothetical protein
MANQQEVALTLSTTALADAACLKRYWYRHVENLVPLPNQVSPRIRVGVWCHALLRAYHHDRSLSQTYRALLEGALNRGVSAAQCREAGEEAQRLIAGYVWYWRQHGEEWTVLLSEAPLSFDRDGVRFRATIDLLVAQRDGVWLVEHKTTSQLPDPVWRGVDPQTAIQLLACEANGYHPKGVIFNYLITKVPAPFRLKNDGEPYADSLKGSTTTIAFEQGIADEIARAAEKPKLIRHEAGYYERFRHQVVNDAAYYLRFPTRRADPMLQETLADALARAEEIQRAQETERWTRAFHPLGCRLTCPFGKLDMTEYVLGHPADSMRREYFMADDGVREGDDAWDVVEAQQ